ncbi:hypothetical protein C8R45DRAFT_1212432, partial [Mycena sanguinolenta]
NTLHHEALHIRAIECFIFPLTFLRSFLRRLLEKGKITQHLTKTETNRLNHAVW